MAVRSVLDRAGIEELIARLGDDGYTVVGPTEHQQTIVYDEIHTTADFPSGRRDEQGPGTYTLIDGGGSELFGYVVGPHGVKRFLHPPRAVVWSGERSGGGFTTLAPPPPPRFAFFGIRPCDLAAVGVQDRVFLPDGPLRDDVYSARRQGVFIAVVNCTRPGGTCFCASMGTGPGADAGYDLAITEVVAEPGISYLVETGTPEGERILEGVGRPASDDEVAGARALVADAAQHMGRELDTHGIHELLHANLENPHWQTVADRCLGCTNCTMVCPTCFCTTIDDSLSLDGVSAQRTRRWDSCFTLEFSYIHGGSIRQSGESRYRQWMTHKLGSWIDQFGTSGCVGCGRCITWCPVGIDITAESAAIRASDVRRLGTHVPTPGVRS